MPNHIACLWTVEPLGLDRWRDSRLGAGQRYFGITGSMSLVSDTPASPAATADEIDLLRPWHWNRDAAGAHRLAVRAMLWNGDDATAPIPLLAPGGATLADVRIHPAFPLRTGAHQPVWAAVEPRLEAHFADFRDREPTPRRFFWDPTHPFGEHASRPWHIFLANVATSPYPIPQLANLSAIFAVPETAIPAAADGLRLYAALEFETAGGSVTLRDATSTTPAAGLFTRLPGAQGGPGTPARWEYATTVQSAGAALPARAYIDGAELAPPAKGTRSRVDLTTGWINTSEVLPGERELRATLPERAAAFFDLAQWVVDGARRHLDAPEVLRGKLGLVRDLALVALHDQADDGMRVGPRGQGLLQFLWSQWTEVVRDAAVAAGEAVPDLSSLRSSIERAVAKQVPLPLLDWTRMLAGALPAGTRELPVVTVDLKGTFADLGASSLREVVDQLQAVRSAIAETSVASTLVLAQWGLRFADLATTAAETALLTQFLDFARARMADLQVQRWLGLGTLGSSEVPVDPDEADPPPRAPSDRVTGGVWPTVLEAIDEASTLDLDARRALLADAVVRAFARRFTVGGDATTFEGRAHPRVPSPEHEAVASLLAPIDATEAAARLVLPSPVLAPTQFAHPVVLEVEIRSPSDAQTGGADDDVLRRIAGIGVVASISPNAAAPNEWFCLNAARVEGTAAPMLVPARLVHAQDERQTLLAYDNHPLTSRDPRARITDHELMPGAAHERDDSEIFCFESLVPAPAGPGGCPPAWHRLPGLVFGRDYRFRAFAVTNAGALPAGLVAADTYPAELRADANVAVPSSLPVKYRRRVPVGEPRLRIARLDDASESPITGSKQGLKLPEIPPTVSPRARELENHAEPDPDSGDRPERARPLLMLTPPGGRMPARCEFVVRPPATDIETWDRWVAAVATDPCTSQPAGVRELRASVRADYTWQTLENHRDAAHRADPFDVSLDDPAVARLDVEVDRFLNGRWSRVAALGESFAIPALSGSGIGLAQHPGFRVAVNVTPREGKTPATATEPVTLSLVAGGLYRLRVVSRLRQPETARFERGVPGLLTPRPYEMDIEVATTAFATAMQLRGALEASLEANIFKVSLPVEKMSAVDADVRATIHRVELMRQVWQWRGRPTTLADDILSKASVEWIDAGAKVFPLGGPHLWETREFGERLDLNHAMQEMEPRWPAPPGDAVIRSAAAVEPTFAYEEDLSQDPRALYARLAVRAFSRYADLFDESCTVPLVADTRIEGWRSALIPCRLDKPPQPPVIRAVLPLTEPATDRPSSTDPASQPGMLAIFGEPWYEQGGLAEKLEIQLAEPETEPDMTVGPPAPVPARRPSHQAIGFDPIISGDAWTEAVDPEVTFTGPVGHTFDRSGLPRFVSSSFMIDAPKLTGKGDVRYPWVFAKLRFRRRIVRSPAAGGELRSDWTPAFWVQYLPAFSMVEQTPGSARPISLAEMEIRRTTEALQLHLRRSAEPWRPTPARGFHIMLLLTTPVTDITGRGDQEAYIGMLSVDPAGRWTPLQRGTKSVTLPALGVPVRARLVELQLGSDRATSFAPKNEEELWTRIFGDSDKIVDRPEIEMVGGKPRPLADPTTERNRVRIVRISNAILSGEGR